MASAPECALEPQISSAAARPLGEMIKRTLQTLIPGGTGAQAKLLRSRMVQWAHAAGIGSPKVRFFSDFNAQQSRQILQLLLEEEETILPPAIRLWVRSGFSPEHTKAATEPGTKPIDAAVLDIGARRCVAPLRRFSIYPFRFVLVGFGPQRWGVVWRLPGNPQVCTVTITTPQTVIHMMGGLALHVVPVGLRQGPSSLVSCCVVDDNWPVDGAARSVPAVYASCPCVQMMSFGISSRII